MKGNRSRSLLGFAAAAACVCLCAGLRAQAADRYAAAVAYAGRSAADVKRDALDRPAEILRLTGVGPGMSVADVLAGDGYYSELLSYLVGPKGRVLSINNAAFDAFSDGDRQKRLEGGRLPNVEHQTVDLNDMHLPQGTLDAVLLIKVYHDLYWVETDGKFKWPKIDTNAVLSQLAAALKPGGVLMVVDHSAKPGRRSGRLGIASHRRGLCGKGYRITRSETDRQERLAPAARRCARSGHL